MWVETQVGERLINLDHVQQIQIKTKTYDSETRETAIALVARFDGCEARLGVYDTVEIASEVMAEVAMALALDQSDALMVHQMPGPDGKGDAL